MRCRDTNIEELVSCKKSNTCLIGSANFALEWGEVVMTRFAKEKVMVTWMHVVDLELSECTVNILHCIEEAVHGIVFFSYW